MQELNLAEVEQVAGGLVQDPNHPIPDPFHSLLDAG